jgi:pimeloyl-ACP methyl ester carboxylesterase
VAAADRATRGGRLSSRRARPARLHLSSRPAGVAPYAADRLADDICGLIRELGYESAMLVGHDWGGTVAWTTAMNHPEVVERLAILDAAHPRRLQKGLFNPRQLLRSWYFFFFAFPGLPERVVHARRFRFFRRFLRDARPPYAQGAAITVAPPRIQPPCECRMTGSSVSCSHQS